MAAPALQQVYRYAQPSTVGAGTLHLATSGAPDGAVPEPFLRAKVVQPHRVALALRLVSDVVRSRHHIPAAMLERILIASDPVLTWGHDTLRVEGFSSCCGMYARADISERALELSSARHGTTNVDFNGAMRGALARIRAADELQLLVGDDGVSITHDADGGETSVIERKVRLPTRWLRGFVEVQAICRRMQPRLQLERAAAVRFLRGLPRSGRSSDAAWVIPSGRSARLGSAKRAGAIRVAGLARLRALEPGLALAKRAIVHEDPHTGASAWRLDGEDVALTVVLSPETWRGFSGEGQVLSDVATTEPKLAAIHALLSWQSELPESRVARDTGLDADGARAMMAWLATRGLVGYDVAREAWFHRVLPVDLPRAIEMIEAHHPRLKGAQKLLDDGAVSITQRGAPTRAEVASAGVVYRVRLEADRAVCGCPWYAKHEGERGPCKHVLAVEMFLAREQP